MCDYLKHYQDCPANAFHFQFLFEDGYGGLSVLISKPIFANKPFLRAANFIQDYSLYILLFLVSPFTGC